jgi:predicted Zn-dependent protease with MMP-like domain/lipopolysaccharide biosynthesis regulator YciM
MARTTVESILDEAQEALAEGELKHALDALARARKKDANHPAVHMLEATIWAEQGKVDKAITRYLEIAREHPDEPAPWINAALLELHSRNRPEAAIELVDKGLELVDDEDELTAAILCKAEACLALGEPGQARARDALSELAVGVLDDPYDLIAVASLWLDAGAPKKAIELLADLEDADEAAADANHLLGQAYAELGRDQDAASVWLQTLRLDEQALRPPWSLPASQFEAGAQAALSELPPRALELLANVPILIEDAPSREQVAEGLDPRVLGVFSGVPLAEQSGTPADLTTITLFQRNLEAVVDDGDELLEQIRITVLHETAHFFGLDDEELERIGLG